MNSFRKAPSGRAISAAHLLIDIRNFPEILDMINSVINSRRTAEVKLEKRNKDLYIAVYETARGIKDRIQLPE